ncbi:hypothetical protein [Rhodococcus pyridinivorans]|uniref:DUF7373 family lipoprotein n=1 Tax=Rhodococcus pyridinivorans TaxID=103816 RepID=UPI0039B3AA1B
MRTSRATRAVLAVATATILTVAGCGSDTTVAGNGTEPATSPEQESTEGIDIASLDTGEYRVEPRDFVGENFAAGEAGPVIEGQQMAEFVVHDIDPTLTTGRASIPPAVPVAVPGAPETPASVRSWDVIGRVTTTTVTPQGNFVIQTYASSETGDAAWTTDIAARGARAQATLPPVRPCGLRAGRMAALRFTSRTYREDLRGHRNRPDRQGRVERLPHAGAAEAELLRDDFVETTREMYPDLVEDETVPQNISGTRCWSGDVAQGRASVCLMVYGRYMAEFSGLRPVGNEDPANDSLRTMSQRLATQYVKFVRSEEMSLGEN